MSIRSLLLIFTIVTAASSFSSGQNQITTFILVRHAEKILAGGDDPSLKPEGTARAGRLATMLEKSRIDAIYSTAFKRTRETVTPLATSKGLDITVYESLKESPIDQMLKDHPGGTIVICGHSNSIPWIANLLTGSKTFNEFDEADYSNFLVIDVLIKGKSSKATWLRY